VYGSPFGRYHVASDLCAEASSTNDAATISLQTCVHGKTTQQFRNDYTSIRNRAAQVTLGSYDYEKKGKLALCGTEINGQVTLNTMKNQKKDKWSKWSYFPNSKQLRNQYNSDTTLGYPQCLSVKTTKTKKMSEVEEAMI